MTTQEMMKTKSALGGWKNISHLGEQPNWVEDYPPESVDPNNVTIFGYSEKALMQKQYK
jgi:hypothetical protein